MFNGPKIGFDLIPTVKTIATPAVLDRPAMPDVTTPLIVLVGLLLITASLVKRGLEAIGLPPMLGFIGLGLLLNAVDFHSRILGEVTNSGLEFLAKAGVTILLFRVGLESNLGRLIEQFRRASFVWIGDVLFSFGIGYLVARELLSIPLVPSLAIATALSATSLGIAGTAWRDARALKSNSGALLTDVAELDDISGVFMLALLLALIPVLTKGNAVSKAAIAGTTVTVPVKFLAFCALCYLFARYLERPLRAWFIRQRPAAVVIVVVAGIGFLISGIASLLGFSVAIGVLFAGLAFSRDPAENKIDRGFEYLFLMFSPFFFIGIGLSVEIDSLGEGVLLGLVLLAAAATGKFFGVGLSTWLITDRRTGSSSGSA